MHSLLQSFQHSDIPKASYKIVSPLFKPFLSLVTISKKKKNAQNYLYDIQTFYNQAYPTTLASFLSASLHIF